MKFFRGSWILCFTLLAFIVGLYLYSVVSCNADGGTLDCVDSVSYSRVRLTIDVPTKSHCMESTMEVIDTCNLRLYIPNYSRIDLVCDSMPLKDDESVIMVAEAAFTGKLLDTFKHSNIAGDHVSNGKREKGYPCKRNNGAFVWYNGTAYFLHDNYSAAFDVATDNGGCGFAQEMMIHKGKIVSHIRPDYSCNEFRALCLINGKVVIADSKGNVKFGDFISNLLKVGATEALYLDMGFGWNYSWYRDSTGKPVEIHPTPTKYATNWITFYK